MDLHKDFLQIALMTDNGKVVENSRIGNQCFGIINNSGTILDNPITYDCGRNTTTTVTPNPASTPIGTSMTFHVKVVDSDILTKTLPTGSVKWNDGGTGGSFSSDICTLRPLTSISVCTVTYTAPSPTGSVTITATYFGDNTYKTSFGTSTLTVTLRNTTTTITPDPAVGSVGKKMTFHVKVVDSSGGIKTMPTGLVNME